MTVVKSILNLNITILINNISGLPIANPLLCTFNTFIAAKVNIYI